MHGASVQGAPRRIGTARRLYDWRGGLKELREYRRAELPHPRVGQAEGKALAVALATASDPAADAYIKIFVLKQTTDEQMHEMTDARRREREKEYYCNTSYQQRQV